MTRNAALARRSCVPFADIARMTGAPEPTVKSRMRYALEALRQHLLAAGVDGAAVGRTAS